MWFRLLTSLALAGISPDLGRTTGLPRNSQLFMPDRIQRWRPPALELSGTQVCCHPRPNTRFNCAVYKIPASLWYLKLEGHVIERCTLSTLYTSVSHFIDTVLEVSVTNSAMVSGQMRAVSKGLDTT